jgi:uncharacterized protein (DUF952 family)
VARIHHIARRREWEEAEAHGEYRWSTRGLTLDEVGFVHCSTPEQVAGVAARFYADEPEPLVLLTIEVERLGVDLVYEAGVGTDEHFPHVYGPISVDAVVLVDPIERDASGGFVLPGGLA